MAHLGEEEERCVEGFCGKRGSNTPLGIDGSKIWNVEHFLSSRETIRFTRSYVIGLFVGWLVTWFVGWLLGKSVIR